MNISSFNGGKNASIKYILDKIDLLVQSSEITEMQALSLISDAMNLDWDDNLLSELPRVEEDGFVRIEDVEALVEAANINYIALGIELDAMQAVVRSISEVAKLRSASAQEAINISSTAIAALQTYLKTRKSGADSIVVDFAELDGDYSLIDGGVIGKIISSRENSLRVLDVNTNATAGNLLELDENTEGMTSLTGEEIFFKESHRRNTGSAGKIVDKEPGSIFEVEMYSVLEAVKKNNYIPVDYFLSESGQITSIDWDVDKDKQLWLELELDAKNANISRLVLEPVLRRSLPFVVERIDVSDDGERWVEIDRDTYMVPDVSTYLDDTRTFRGKGVWTVPLEKIDKIRIRASQSNGYLANIAHVAYLKDEDLEWVGGPGFDIDGTKSGFFSPRYITDDNGDVLQRHVFAISAIRKNIAIENVTSFIDEYQSLSMFKTNIFELPVSCSSVSIKADEDIPTGTRIKYELSYNDGTTWEDLHPVNRSEGGVEVLVFSGSDRETEINSSIRNISVNSPVKTLQLRATLHSTKGTSPMIRSLSIVPVLNRG